MFKMDHAQNKILRKVLWSCIAAPMLYNSWWAYGWQCERKKWKEDLIAERTRKLRQPIATVTLEDIPLLTATKAEFDEIWLYKPIKLRGLFDHEKETFIQRTRDGDRGYEILSPLYMRVDKNTGDLHGLMINRGRIPYEYRDSQMHWTPPNVECEVEGVLFYDEGDDQYNIKGTEAAKNTKAANAYSEIRINLKELLGKTDIANQDFASKVYLKSVSMTLGDKIEQAKLPRPAIPADLCYWYVTPSKHQAYATFWFYLSGLNIAATTFIWFMT